ncbi:hypothetical protein E2C01_056200 [Portunus trituberculatus]|uniref:Uncharacterized protein n=1 Tax=Portunus trituberculatus TaxID=210409 RepID=A0A5B7GYA4_PORTR|nr:hypothetical protein [Portunus trituberculatus]
MLRHVLHSRARTFHSRSASISSPAKALHAAAATSGPQAMRDAPRPCTPPELLLREESEAVSDARTRQLEVPCEGPKPQSSVEDPRAGDALLLLQSWSRKAK